jgi:hypothetical protein
MSKPSKYFKIYELVSRAVFNKYGESAWQFLDQKAIDTLDWIRENIHRKMYVNDWYWNHTETATQYRGYRHEEEYSGGALKSIHKRGGAFDSSVDGMTDEEYEAWIWDNQDGLPHPIRIELEDTRTKVHWDVGYFSTGEKIYYFKP